MPSCWSVLPKCWACYITFLLKHLKALVVVFFAVFQTGIQDHSWSCPRDTEHYLSLRKFLQTLFNSRPLLGHEVHPKFSSSCAFPHAVLHILITVLLIFDHASATKHLKFSSNDTFSCLVILAVVCLSPLDWALWSWKTYFSRLLAPSLVPCTYLALTCNI